jgi:diguanylate cyclase (GGDEF)-like protein
MGSTETMHYVLLALLSCSTLVLGVMLCRTHIRNTHLNADLCIQKEKTDFLFTQSITDPLTGLTNRRWFEERLNSAFRKERRFAANLVVLIVADLDRFKDINDRYGHNVGDSALQEMARVLRFNTRSEDVVTRYGGDEFLLLVNLRDEAAIAILMEKLRLAIASIRIQVSKHEHVGITSSLGACVVDTTHFDQAAGVIHAADEAMYKSKEDGGNSCWFKTRSDKPEFVRLTPEYV